MRRSAVLSPRGITAELPDLASRGRLVAGQRVSSYRRRRRVTRRARRFAVGMLWVLGVLAVLSGTAWAGRWFFRSPRFAVAMVEVSGNQRLTRETIETVADIDPGINLFAVDTGAVAARLESLALVRHAQVTRILPNRVSIEVEERRPWSLVHAGALHWIDEEGVDLGPETRAVAVGAPLLSGVGPDELATARRPPSERAVRGIALQRLLLRAQSPLLQQIAEIDVSRPEGPVLYTVNGVEVRLGGEDWEPRLGRLQGVLAQLSTSGEAVTSVDLRFRDQVVLKHAVK